MPKFLIEPHFRLQEWVAEEKNYFRQESLDYEFRELVRATDGKIHDKGSKGAFQSFEEGRKASVSCACHWTVNMAASNDHGGMWGECYSVSPGGIFVAKVFQGGAEGTLLAALKRDFAIVRHAKPPASRTDSAEMYVVATGFRGG